MRRIEEEAQRMRLLVDELLLLARLDERRDIEPVDVDLAVLAADACSDAAATDPGRTITLDAPRPVVVAGVPDHLRQAIANLVSNALTHTPAGTPDRGLGDRPRSSRARDRARPRARARRRGLAPRLRSVLAGRPVAHRTEVGPRLVDRSGNRRVAWRHGKCHERRGGGAEFTIDLPLATNGAAAAPPPSNLHRHS